MVRGALVHGRGRGRFAQTFANIMTTYAGNQLARATPAQLLSGLGAVYGMGHQFWTWYNDLSRQEQEAVKNSAKFLLNKTRVATSTGMRYLVSRQQRAQNRTNAALAVRQARNDRQLATTRSRSIMSYFGRSVAPSRSVSLSSSGRSRTSSLSRFSPVVSTPPSRQVTVYRDATQDQINASDSGDPYAARLFSGADGHALVRRTETITPGNSFNVAYPRFIRDPTSFRNRRTVKRYLRRSRKSIDY